MPVTIRSIREPNRPIRYQVADSIGVDVRVEVQPPYIADAEGPDPHEVPGVLWCPSMPLGATEAARLPECLAIAQKIASGEITIES